MSKRIKLSVALLLTLPFAALLGKEQDDLWDDDWSEETAANPWRGYFELGLGSRFNKDRNFNAQRTLSEMYLHLEKDSDFEKFKISFKGDFSYDEVSSRFDADIRELVISFSPSEKTDVKIGRQVVTWGTGDLVFLNDFNPKGWKSYFNGRSDVFAKAPSNAIRVQSYFDAVNVDFVWTPRFTPDRYINGENFSFYNPYLDQSVGGQELIKPVKPESKLSNGEFSARLYKNISGTEFAIYAYRGFDKTPDSLTPNFIPTFKRRDAFGASVRGGLGDGLYNIEFVRELSKEDPNGTKPLIKNSRSKLLFGYESEWLPKLNVAFQYYIEQLSDYNALIANSLIPNREVPRHRVWLTNRITHRALQDKLTTTLFTFYSPNEKDWFLRWNINYRQSDQWNYTFGMNWIDGESNKTFFGQFERASNFYFRARYNF